MTTLRVIIQVDDHQLERLSQRGVRVLGGREEPQRAWTNKERAQMARAYLTEFLANHVNEIPKP
jgi:N-acetylmuramoyl-L-alanine amidase